MPKDKAGKFHLNSQKAMASDKMSTKAEPKAPPLVQAPPAPDGQDSAMSGAPSSAADHLTQLHAESGGTHMHVSDDGMGGITSHHIGDDGAAQGPHEHLDHEALKEHMGQVFGGGERPAHGGGHMGGHSGGMNGM